MICSRRLRIEREIELVLPAKLKARFGKGIVTQLGARMSLCQVGGMSGDLIGNHPIFHVVYIRQSQMLFGRNVAKHCRAEPADHSRADCGSDMVVTRRDIGGEGT